MKITIEKGDGGTLVNEGQYAVVLMAKGGGCTADTIFDEGSEQATGDDACRMAAVALAHIADSFDLPKDLFPMFVAKVSVMSYAYLGQGVERDISKETAKPKAKTKKAAKK